MVVVIKKIPIEYFMVKNKITVFRIQIIRLQIRITVFGFLLKTSQHVQLYSYNYLNTSIRILFHPMSIERHCHDDASLTFAIKIYLKGFSNKCLP